MKCRNCGAKIRKMDRFCPSCGLSADPSEDRNEYPGARAGSGNRNNQKKSGSRTIREPLYDEHLYKDSFLEEKKEERSQALLITLAVLLLVALLTAGFLAFYFMVRQHRDGVSGNGRPGTDWGQSVEDPQADGDGVITIFQDETEPVTEKMTAAQTENIPAETEQTEKETPAQTDGTEAFSAAETETEVTERESAVSFDEIARIVREHSEAEQYGVSIYDLKQKNAYVAGSGNEPMYTSAVVTVPILYTAAVLVDAGTVSMDEPIVYVNSIGGRGEAYPESRDGTEYPLSYYLTTMLTYSDNNCINVLIDRFGLDTINETCHKGGFESVDLQRKIVAVVSDGTENYASAADLGGMVRDLYDNTFTGIDRAFLEQYFRIDESDEGRTVIGLAEGVSGAEMFLNQDGMGETRFAETAVVAGEGREYIISIMMTGQSGFAYIDAGIELSEYVWEALGVP